MKFRFVIPFFIPILLGLSACSKSGDEQAITKNWAEYKEPNVFSIKHPEGWTVQFDKKRCRVKVTSTKDETIYIWPVYSSAILNKDRGEKLLKKVASQLEPQLDWNMQTSKHDYLKLLGSNEHQAGAASMSWVSNENNSAAICYIISAPRNYFETDKEDIIGILSSFNPIITRDKKSTQPKPEPIQFIRWQDPNEHAFAAEVPKNWHVQGGLKRYSPSDYRPGVNLISPDNEINVFFMDPGIPFFSLPNQTLSMTGFTPGTWYQLQDGTRTFVRSYVSGENFAHEYTIKRFSNELNNFSIQGIRSRPDIARIDNREYMQLNATSMGMMQENNSAGEVTFSGYRNNQTYSGYVEAATLIIQTQYGGGLWQVQQLYGFNAPESKKREAAEVMEKLVSSFMWNPQWYRMQSKTRANVSEIVSQAAEQISNIINSSFELGQKRMESSTRKFSDYIRGTITLQDENGERFNVWNTSNYYWANKFDEVGGTKLFKNPDLSQFRRLVEVK